ncbi:MAG: MBL fold metallo-hydrolase [Candidatus Methanofastidiosia archaeon]|jgi:glyoxylase-like metal-dependent hydrolase (beta-lactamase superfamily II)
MKVQKIKSRGIVFTFYMDNYPTNVFVINGKDHYFVCDTFLGPEPMEKLKHYLIYTYGKNPFIVINSHYHWDHIWGNCAFDSDIISHVLCRKAIAQKGEQELQEYSAYQQGTVKLVLPTITFTDALLYPDEDIEIVYTPGHTADSVSVIDHTDQTIFVGDNVEAPIPYLFYENLKEYIKTLQYYLDMDIETIIPGHGTIPEKLLIQKNLEYVKAFVDNDTKEYETEIYQPIHAMNKKIQDEIELKRKQYL